MLICPEHLFAFLEFIGRDDIPTVDVDACLQKIVNCVKKQDQALVQIQNLAYAMAYGDELFEKTSEFPEGYKFAIFYAVKDLGTDVKKMLEQQHAYSGNYLPYDFRKLINGTTLLLQ